MDTLNIILLALNLITAPPQHSKPPVLSGVENCARRDDDGYAIPMPCESQIEFVVVTPKLEMKK